MNAIEVRYHGPTDTRGTRLSVRIEGRPSVFYPYDYAQDLADNARRVARCYAEDRGWHGALVLGALPRGGWAAVFIPNDDIQTRLFNRAVAEIAAETAWEETI